MMRYARKSEYTFYVIIKADYLNSRYQKPRSKDHNYKLYVIQQKY